MPYLKAILLVLMMTAAAPVARAHAPGAVSEDSSWVVGLLLVAALAYCAGLLRLRPHVHARRELWWRAGSFALGWAALAAALLSPIDRYTANSFAWHMIQHEVLMLVAAPLLVIGRALPSFLWALPHDARLAVGRATKAGWLRGAWDALTSPLSAWLLHAGALWLWHVPAFFNAAVTRPGVHDWQHASFLLTALVFWHALLRKGHRGREGMALLYLFTTTIHTGVLGALLTFAPRPLYATLDSGLRNLLEPSALEDQQLGGLIMWVPGAIVYVLAGLLLAARWLRALEGNHDSRSVMKRSGPGINAG